MKYNCYNVYLLILTDQVKCLMLILFHMSRALFGTIITNQFQTTLMNLSKPENSKMSGISHLLLVPQCIQHLQLQVINYNQIDVNFYYHLPRRQTE